MKQTKKPQIKNHTKKASTLQLISKTTLSKEIADLKTKLDIEEADLTRIIDNRLQDAKILAWLRYETRMI